MTPTELPEGPRILLDEKTGDRFVVTPQEVITGIPGNSYYLAPHIERKPLFVDLAGNPVFEGEAIYSYNKEMGITSIGAADKEEEDWHECEIYGPSFKYESDLEKWVASNVKTLTLEEALRMAGMELITKFRLQAATGSLGFEEYITDLIKEKCFTPKR